MQEDRFARFADMAMQLLPVEEAYRQTLSFYEHLEFDSQFSKTRADAMEETLKALLTARERMLESYRTTQPTDILQWHARGTQA